MSGPGSTASEILTAAGRRGGRWLSGIRGGLLALAILAALLGALHREVLFSSSVYHMDDAADCYYPGRVAYRRALSEGTLPSWEPNTLAGWPLLADPYYGYFYPLNFVFYLGPRRGEPATGFEGGVPSGLGLAVVLHALLAGGAMYAYLRRRRSRGQPLGFGAALFGALGYALSSFMVVRIRHIIFIQILAWLPLLLLFLDDYLETQRRRSLALCGLLFGVMLLTGAHSILHFVVLLLFVYGLCRFLWLVAGQPAGKRLRFAWSLGWPLLLAVAGGALLGAVALLPTLSAMPNTTRSLGTDYKFASSYAWPSLRYLSLLIAPDSLGPGETRQQEWFAPWNHWELAGYYQGIVAAILALPGAILPRRGQWPAPSLTESAQPRWRLWASRLWQGLDGERVALLVCLLFGIALALGDHGPLHPFLYRYMPLYAALRCPSRGLVLFVVAAPILAAHAVEFLFADRRSGHSREHTAGAAAGPSLPRRVIGLVLALSLLALGAYLAFRAQGDVATALPPMKWALRSRAQLALVLGSFLALLSLRWLCGFRGLLLLLPLCTLSASDQWLTDRGYVLPQPIDYPYGMERFHAVEWVRQKATQPPPGQAVADRFVADPRGPFRMLAVGETLGIPSASGYGSVQIWRYAQLLYILRHGRPYPHRKQVDDMAAAGVWNFRSPIVDMLNIRYLIWTDPPSDKWQQVFPAPVRQPPSARYEPGWDAQLAVFENRKVMPRAYLTQSLRWAADEAEEARLLAQPDFDPHTQTIVGPVPPLARRGWAGVATPWPPLPATTTPETTIQPAQIVAYERHRVVVEAETASAAMLVLADAYYPGWSATVDGVPQAIYPVNLALRGVPLPPGKHRIEFRYAQAPLRRGLRLSALGLILLAGLGWLPLRRRRQHTEGA
jgi:hypothetical protein